MSILPLDPISLTDTRADIILKITFVFAFLKFIYLPQKKKYLFSIKNNQFTCDTDVTVCHTWPNILCPFDLEVDSGFFFKKRTGLLSSSETLLTSVKSF